LGSRRRDEWLSLVVIGAGATGVEMAGQIAELARETLRRDVGTADRAGAGGPCASDQRRAGAAPSVAGPTA
jgi:hypothetical protein